MKHSITAVLLLYKHDDTRQTLRELWPYWFGSWWAGPVMAYPVTPGWWAARVIGWRWLTPGTGAESEGSSVLYETKNTERERERVTYSIPLCVVLRTCDVWPSVALVLMWFFVREELCNFSLTAFSRSNTCCSISRSSAFSARVVFSSAPSVSCPSHATDCPPVTWPRPGPDSGSEEQIHVEMNHLMIKWVIFVAVPVFGLRKGRRFDLPFVFLFWGFPVADWLFLGSGITVTTTGSDSEWSLGWGLTLKRTWNTQTVKTFRRLVLQKNNWAKANVKSNLFS